MGLIQRLKSIIPEKEHDAVEELEKRLEEERARREELERGIAQIVDWYEKGMGRVFIDHERGDGVWDKARELRHGSIDWYLDPSNRP